MKDEHLQYDNHNFEFDLQSYLVYQTQRCPCCMQTLSRGISAGSVNITNEWMSVDTLLRNLKAETTVVPFHRVQQGKDDQDFETDETLLGSFYLFSILTQA